MTIRLVIRYFKRHAFALPKRCPVRMPAFCRHVIQRFQLRYDVAWGDWASLSWSGAAEHAHDEHGYTCGYRDVQEQRFRSFSVAYHKKGTRHRFAGISGIYLCKYSFSFTATRYGLNGQIETVPSTKRIFHECFPEE